MENKTEEDKNSEKPLVSRTLYRFIQHTMDDDLNNEIQSKADNGWMITNSFPPQKFKDSDDFYIGIIWMKVQFLKS